MTLRVRSGGQRLGGVLYGGVLVPLGPECRLTRPAWKASGSVEQTPTGRVYATDPATGIIPQPSQATLTWVVRGVSPLRAEQALAAHLALLDAVNELWEHQGRLDVLRLAEAPSPEMGFGGLSWRGSHVYDLISPLYTLPTGLRSRTPIAPGGLP
ncbi:MULTISPECIES: hypothetical protein [Deinococcus]|uniref:Uncharacterized protein n=1 Tax=Deinococcus rufus TaxID=2136097 RepID=A0ABV7ZDT4_9DEIO|nr:hypothetical protein [Deinococcus sp. AB2017081]WQE94034.1 hypothetical protein U2P90_11505 [Deinococcus sp. AB2017081]